MRALILGGTSEARELAERLSARAGVEVVSSLAGRVNDPALPVGETVIGGFGGAAGLADFLAARRIEVVVDATHPFARTISAHADEATRRAATRLVTLHRPGWTEGSGDRWTRVPSVAAAAAEVRRVVPADATVFVTTGRRDLTPYAEDDDRHYLIRTVDPPGAPLPKQHTVLLSRGPYRLTGERALFEHYAVAALVTKDSGGDATRAKLDAARSLDVPVVMVDRPPPPSGELTHTVHEALTALLG